MLHKNAIAYAATTVGASMMSTVFQFYYVKLFLNVYRISETWFNIAQVVYLVWNAVNDPLFGYIQDTSPIQVLKHRRLNILYGAPIYAISFLLPWFPWTSTGKPEWLVGLHLIVTLCFYDGMLTFVLLAQCSLFAEITREEKERQVTVKYSAIGSIIGSCSIFLCEVVVTDLHHPSGLQLVCIFIAIAAFLLMACSGKNIKTVVDRDQTTASHLDEGKNTQVPMLTLIRQIIVERKFVSFVTTNFCQVFHTTFCANFFGIFRDSLFASGVFPPLVLSLTTGSAFVLPQIIVLATGTLLGKFGFYKWIMWSFYVKVAFALIMYILGKEHFWLLALFMIIDNALPNSAFGLFNLPLSDIIDCDQKLYQRSHPVSSSIFGTNALITKPAQSIAPMITVYILTQYGYKDVNSPNTSASKMPVPEQLQNIMFLLLCGVPFVLGCIQIFCWRLYNEPQTKAKNNYLPVTVD